MAAKLSLELENKTKKGFDEIVKDLDRVGVETKDTEKAVEQLNKELESRAAADQAKAIKSLADEYDGTSAKAREAEKALEGVHQAAIGQSRALQQLDTAAQEAARKSGKLADYQRDLKTALDERKVKAYKDEINRLADEMSGLGNANKKVESSFPKWTEVASKISLVKQALGGVVWGMHQASSAVDAFAERGSPGFLKLQKAVERLQDSLLKIGDDPTLQRWVENLADGIESRLVPTLGRAASWLLKMGEGAVEGAVVAEVGWMRFFGLISQQQENLVNIGIKVRRAVNDKQDEERKKDNVEREKQRLKEKEEALQDLQDPGAKMRQDIEKADRIAEIADREGIRGIEKEINELKEKQFNLVKKIKDEAGDPSKNKKVVEQAKELISLEQKRFELLKKNKDAEKAIEDELFAKRVQHLKDFELLKERAAKRDLARELELANLEEARRNAERAADQEKIEKLRDFMKGGGIFGVLGGGGGQMGGGFGGGMGGGGQGGWGGPGGFNPAMGGQAPMGGGWPPQAGGMPQGGPGFGGGGPGGRGGGWKGLRGQGARVIREVEPDDIVNTLGENIGQKQINDAVLRRRLEKKRQEIIDEERAAGRTDQHGRALTDEEIFRANMGPDLGRKPNRDFLDQKAGKEGVEPGRLWKGWGQGVLVDLNSPEAQAQMRKDAEAQREKMRRQKEELDEEAEYGPTHPETFPDFQKKKEELSKQVAKNKAAAEANLKQAKIDRQKREEESEKEHEENQRWREEVGWDDMQIPGFDPEAARLKRDAELQEMKEKKAAQAKTDAKLKKQMALERSRFNKQAKGKKGEGIPLDEQAEAWGELMDTNVELLEGTGKVSKNMMTLVKETVVNQKNQVNLTLKMAEEQKTLWEAIKEVRELQRQLMQGGRQPPSTTKKAQNSSN